VKRSASREDPRTRLAASLHAAAIHLLRRVRRADDAVGLSPARLSALSVIVFAGPLRISDLARAEQVRVPTITPVVAALEREALITREEDASDARVSLVRATPRGARLMAEGRARRVAILAAELAALSADERRALGEAARILERTFTPPR
jgi:DNA-binding MarR family transcriptional regulator